MLIPEVVVAVFFATSVVSQKVIELSKSEWTLENLPLNITVPGAVPSQAHLDLYAAQVIGDPYAMRGQPLPLRLICEKVLWLE